MLKDLFEKKTIRGVPKKEENLNPNEQGFYMYGQNILRQYDYKILCNEKYLQRVDENYPILAYASSVGEVGLIKESFYRSGNNGAFQGLFPKKKYSFRVMLYIVASLKLHFKQFNYDTSMADVINLKISLPIKDGEIDYEFMEKFIAELEAEQIAELEAYLTAAGLKNTILTAEEEFAIENFSSQRFEKFLLKDLFNEIHQGRRLKKDDQISGKIPFVMSGVTNCGVVGYISNPVAKFPKNSITVDIFGNTFYRGYNFGAGDDTGVYWNSEKNYSAKAMLFFAAAIEKSLTGKFSYGNKLRSSQSKNFEIYLPTKDGEIDFEFMEKFISAVQKIVIVDVVKYSEEKISAYRQAASK